ncbi:MAG: C1 family peptidase, partial [Promethearchaeota archaeon]
MKTIKITLVGFCALLLLITILPLNLSQNSSELGNAKRLVSVNENEAPEVDTPTEEIQTVLKYSIDERVYADPSTVPNYRVSGLLYEDMSENDEYRRSNSDMSALPGDPIPQSVANLAGLPPIGDQGSQGSCTAWAWGYYCLTHQIAAANGYWDTSNSNHQFSPAYIYNQINDGTDSGSSQWDASLLTEVFGCATLDTMSYSDTDWITWPSETAYTEAMKYRTVNPTWDSLIDDADLNVLKAYLADGNTAVIGIEIYSAFYSFDTVNNVYTTSHIVGDPVGGHAVCLVGYDDNKATTDGSGAFLLVNSWGPGWGDSGFWWMSYEAIKNYDICHRQVYYCDVISQPHSPDLVGSIRLSHEKRGDVLEAGLMISLDVNGYEQHWELLSIGPTIAQRSGLYQNHPFPGNLIVFDLSDFTPYLSMYFENEFIILIGDSVWPVSGVLESFTVTSLEYSIEASSSQTPHTILDNQPREEVSAFLALPYVAIDPPDTYVGGTVEITGTVHGECEDTVVDIGFEPGSFEHPWYTNDANSDNGDQLWGVDTYHSFSGGSSMWCGGTPSSTAIYTEHFNPLLWLGWPSGWTLYSAGTNSHPWTSAGVPLEYEITCSTGGLSDVKEWAYYGPLDTSSATELCLTFWMDYEVENAVANNFASFLYSTDGSTFTYLERWWAPVGETCSFTGEQKIMLPEDAISSTLYFAFIFQGDYTGSMTVDDIDIWDIGSEYENSADSYAYCYIDISNFDSATMSFDYWANVEDGWDWFSPAYYIGSTWTTPYSLGTTTGWQHFTLSIPTSATRIGFLFHSDSSIVEQGVYVDNVKLIGLMDPISTIEIFVDDESQGFTPCVSIWSFMWDTTSVTDGLHNVSTTAIFGISTISDTESTFVDNTAPVLSSDTEFYQSGNNITICGY